MTEMRMIAFIKGSFINYENKEGAEVEVVRLNLGNQSLIFKNHLIDDCFENRSRIACKQAPINQFNWSHFDNVKWIKIVNKTNLTIINNEHQEN